MKNLPLAYPVKNKNSHFQKENSKLRETPDVQRLEEELLQVKMRDAEAQLAIKELQKTIHVLNLEYQEFLNNRSAVILSLSNGSSSASHSPDKTIVNNTHSSGNNRSDQSLEEELLKIKMREAEALSEMKSLNLKLMQLDTEKQVAYNQIKRQDEEIRKLNAQIQQTLEKEQDSKSQLTEYRRQLDDKEAQLRESNMTHKIQEVEDASVIAELRQRVASLEVHVQELLTTGQLNDADKNFNFYNGISSSTDKLLDFNDEIKLLLMSSQTSLTSDKLSYFRNNINKAITTPSTPTTTVPVNNFLNGASTINGNISNGNSGSLISLPDSTNSSSNSTSKKLINRSRSEDHNKFIDKKKMNEIYLKTSTTTPNQNKLTEYLDSDNEDVLDDFEDKSLQSTSNSNEKSANNSISIDNLEDTNTSSNTSKK